METDISRQKPFENIDHALGMILRAFELGNVRTLARRMHPNCEYISKGAKKEYHSKQDIIKHLQYVSETQLERDIFINCALATVTKAEDSNRFSVNDRCIAIFEKEGCEDVAFATISDDKRYITEIYVLNEHYGFKVDQDCDSQNEEG